MRKHLSVFMLMVRSCIYKLLLIMFAMAAADAIAVVFMPNPRELLYFELAGEDRFFFIYVLSVAIAMSSVLSSCSMGSSVPRYTLARLSISEKAVMYWHWLCGAIVMLALWFWQIILLYVIARWHSAVAEPGFISHQSVYLANFRSPFIHSVLPLEDVSRVARNIVTAICMGGVCATGAHKIRRGKKPVAHIMLISVFAGTFRAEHFEISYDGFVMFVFAIVLIISMVGVYTGDEEVDYEEASLEN